MRGNTINVDIDALNIHPAARLAGAAQGAPVLISTQTGVDAVAAVFIFSVFADVSYQIVPFIWVVGAVAFVIMVVAT